VPKSVAAACCLIAACAPAGPLEAPVDPPARIGTTVEPPPPPPTGWRYHPPKLARMHEALRLDAGRWLLVGELGERWLCEPIPGDGPPRFRARASADRAPETLVTAVPQAGGRFLVVGDSGSVYRAASALGELGMRTAPPAPVVELAGNAQAVIALDVMGGAWRFGEGNWSRLDATPPLFAVAASPSGGLLGLGVPEQLYRSDDAGRSWSSLAGDSLGARGLERGADGEVRVVTVAGRLRWKGGALEDVPREAPPPITAAELDNVEPVRGPRAKAVAEQDAVLARDRYYEIARRDKRWTLVRGRLGEPMATVPVAIETPCDAGTLLTAREDHVLFACASRVPKKPRDAAVDIHRSRDGGSTFERIGTLRASGTPAMAVGPDGAALLTGFCPADDVECKGEAPMRISPGASAITAAVAAELRGAAQSPAWSLDGTALFFLGKRSKDGEPALFVSRDAGVSFSARPLAPPPPARPRFAATTAKRTLLPGADGEIGILLQTGPSSTYFVVDEAANTVAVAQLPTDAAAVGAAGRQLLVVSRRAREGLPMELTLSDSADGGVSFRRVAPPTTFEVDEFDGVAVACSTAGCVLGDRWTRIGWESAGGGGASEAPARDAPAAKRALRTPIACVADDKKPWTAITALHRGPFPTGSQLARGASAWSLLRFDDARGEVEAVGPEKIGGTLQWTRRRLFDKVPDRARFAYHIAPQVEGYAAARVRLPPGSDAIIELAWVNYLDGTAGKATVPGAGPVEVTEPTPGRPHLHLGLLSVSPGGIFLRPSTLRPDVVVVAADGTIAERSRYPSWPGIADADVQSDAVLVGGKPIAVAMVKGTQEADSTVVGLAPLAARDVTSWTTIAPPGPRRRFETSWTYRGHEVGVVVQLYEMLAPRAAAWFLPFAADARFGTAEMLPTQLDVAQPQPCTDAVTRSTPRVVAGFLPGTRHPVLVAAGVESFALVTDRAVLHGTPAAPCVAAWQARSLGGRESAAAVLDGALLAGGETDGWLFRPTGDGTGVEHRPMRCELAPSAPVPEEAWREPGAMAP
jgi:hypothetical protein